MHKSYCILFVSVLVVFIAPAIVNADIIALKDGHTHTGVVTAEEEQRVQIKLDGSGVRIWLSRDQISSIEKSAPEDEGKSYDIPSAESDVPENDEIARARELLKKIREQPGDSKKKKKKKSANPVKNAGTEPAAVVATSAATDAEIQKAIGVLRNGQIYDRLHACEKLAKLEAQEAIPDLIHTLDDESYTIRNAANNALIKITGQDFKYDPKHRRSTRLEFVKMWQKWYDGEKRKEAREQFKSLW